MVKAESDGGSAIALGTRRRSVPAMVSAITPHRIQCRSYSLWSPHGSAYGTKSSNLRTCQVLPCYLVLHGAIRLAFQRYPPSSSAAPRGCVPPAFTGGSGSRWLHGTGYSLRSRVGGSSRPAFRGAAGTPLFASTHAGGTLHADGERPYGPRLHSTAWRPGSRCYVSVDS